MLALCACAMPQQGPAVAVAPGLGGEEPDVSPGVATVVPDSEPEVDISHYDRMSASTLLEVAFRLFGVHQDMASVAAFEAAIRTGNLNDAGKTLAYWHIFLAHRNRGRVDQGADALASFIVMAEDVLDERAGLRYAVDDSGDFVDRFELPKRLAHARAILYAIWAERSVTFGRSQASPVHVESMAEMDFFLELAPPCTGFDERVVSVRSMHGLQGEPLEQVTVTCQDGARTERYFIKVAR